MLASQPPQPRAHAMCREGIVYEYVHGSEWPWIAIWNTASHPLHGTDRTAWLGEDSVWAGEWVGTHSTSSLILVMT
jgi:hypothetical protein